jgi:hypothetical protein
MAPSYSTVSTRLLGGSAVHLLLLFVILIYSTVLSTITNNASSDSDLDEHVYLRRPGVGMPTWQGQSMFEVYQSVSRPSSLGPIFQSIKSWCLGCLSSIMLSGIKAYLSTTWLSIKIMGLEGTGVRGEIS